MFIAHWHADPGPVEVRVMETVERPKTPEPKTVSKVDASELVPEALAPTGDPKATPAPVSPARGPARVVPFGGVNHTKADISRPVTPVAITGVPPPVPKRAAARGTPRPGSMLITPDVQKFLPPKNDRRTVARVRDEGGEKKEDTRVEAEAEGVPKVVAEEAIGVLPVTTEEKKEESKVEAEASAPDPALQETLIVPEVAANTATPNTPINSSSPLPEDTLESTTETTETPPTTSATETTTADQASILSASSASVYTKNTKEVLPSIPATTTTEEDLPEDDEWVGNARWEDRAWNEIVRIREEMFWARVGGGTVGDAEVD